MNQKLQRFHSLNTKLGVVALAALILIAALLAGYFYMQAQIQESLVRTDASGKGRMLCYQLLERCRRLEAESGKDRDRSLQVIQDIKAQMEQRFTALLSEDNRLVNDPELRTRISSQRTQWRDIVLLEVAGIERTAEGATISLTGLSQAIENLAEQINDDMTFERRVIQSGLDYRNTVEWIIAACGLGLLGLVFWISRDVVVRMLDLSKTVAVIAGGDFSHRAEIKGQDEVASLGRTVNIMAESLEEIVQRSHMEQSRISAIVNSTADAIITMNEKGIIRAFNSAAQRLFGYPTTEAIGMNASRVVPALYQEGNSSYQDRDLDTGESQSLGEEFEVMGKTANGREIPLSLRVTELNDAGEKLFIATIQDITSRKENEQQRKKLFEAIRDAVRRLAATSREILATTTQQSQGAQQQAAAVAETVATVEEVAQTAEQAAGRADVVADSARRANEVGQQGRQAVDGSISAMGEVREQVESLAESILSLAERAQAIEEIIATVSDIAEQTNVLALNAAVEASRAGEQGKGFAVVAGEVKSLAGQAKKATSQVRQILGEIRNATNNAVLSTEKGTNSVNHTSEVVLGTGETIKTLSETLTESARTATQISASASQQATGLMQLNQGIKNIDQVAQQNVVAIQQIERAAQDLNSLSNELASLTGEEA